MSERHKAQLTEDQMNELVFADVNDPSAWGEPVVVGPSKGPRRIKRSSTHDATDIPSPGSGRQEPR